MNKQVRYGARTWRRIFLWTSLVLCWMTANVAFAQKPAELGVDTDELNRIVPRLQHYVDEGQISGAVTLVSYRGQLVHLAAVGMADREMQRPMQADSLFCVASMTKPIAAAAVMVLQDEGKLSIDDPVSKYLPEFKNLELANGPPQHEITIRQLMTHTSGLGGSQQTERTLEETVRKITDRQLDFEPGTRWQYSPGLSVCGRIVEVVSGKPFEQFLAERILLPLQMNATTFRPSSEQRARVVQLYKPGEEPKSLVAEEHWLRDFEGRLAPNPSGGLFSTAVDMARFYQMMLNGGELDGQRILSEESVAEMTRIQTDDLQTGFTDGNGWGLGFCVVREPQGVTSMLSPGTYGHGGAFGTQGWVDPERQTIFVLMIQRTGFGNSDASDIRRDFQQIAVEALP